MIDNRHTIVEFWPAGVAELREGNEKQHVDESISMHESASSKVAPQEDITAQTYWTNARYERIVMLDRAASSSFKPRNEAAEGGFEVEVEVKVGERNRFPMMVSYSCAFFEAKNISADRHGAGRQQPCVGCHSSMR